MAIDRVDELAPLVTSFRRHLRAANRSPKTIAKLRGGGLAAARPPGRPRPATGARQDHRRRHRDVHRDLLERATPATAATRYRGLQQFLKWLEAEGEIEASPMLRMRPPSVPDKPMPVLQIDDLGALLRVCEGPGFEQRRDLALLRVLIDTGLRLAELAGLRYSDSDPDASDVDLDANTVTVVGKGNRIRVVRIGAKSVQALDRYRRDRARHPQASTTWLWLSQRGRLTDSGVYQIVRRRAREAGLGPINPHKFRHTFAHL